MVTDENTPPSGTVHRLDGDLLANAAAEAEIHSFAASQAWDAGADDEVLRDITSSQGNSA